MERGDIGLGRALVAKLPRISPPRVLKGVDPRLLRAMDACKRAYASTRAADCKPRQLRTAAPLPPAIGDWHDDPAAGTVFRYETGVALANEPRPRKFIFIGRRVGQRLRPIGIERRHANSSACPPGLR